MAISAQTTDSGLVQQFRQKRRDIVKKLGKRGIRRLGDFLARQSAIEDLPIFETKDFDWAVNLEKVYPAIRKELDQVLVNHSDLPNFHEISPDQAKISKGDNWKTFILFGFGYKSETNCARCPETTKALEAIPNLRTAFFSILSPGYRIPRHKGVTKGVIRGHLGLIVPDDRENCWMRVEDGYIHWREGECRVFDDTYDHEVHNDTDQRRVVLLFDVDRPMHFWGRAVNAIFLRGIRWTAYVQDAKKNLQSDEDRFEAAVARADAMHIDADEPESPRR